VGKSTLCAALLGEAQIRAGEARLADQPLLDGSVVDPSRVGFVPQDNAAIAELTVAQTLRFAAEVRLPEADAVDRDARVRSVLDRLQLTGTSGQRVRQLSGGQRRRVAIAVELLTDPPLLMLDEPTSGLDDGLDRHLMRDLADLAGDGRTVVVVTHSTAHLNYATAVLALSAGRPGRAPSAPSAVGYFGPPEQLVAGFAGQSSADVMDALRNGETSALRSVPVPVTADPVAPEEVRTLVELLVPKAPAELTPAPGWEEARLRAAKASRTGSARHNFAVNLRRELRRLTLRPFWLCFLTVVAPAIIAGIAASINPDGLAGGTGRNPHLGTSIAIVALCLSFLSMALSLTSVTSDLPVIRRERRWGVTAAPVVLARAVSRLPAAVLQAAVATVTLVLLAPGPDHPLPHLPGLLQVFLPLAGLTIASACLGLLIGTIAGSVEHAVGTMSALLASMVILSGTIIPLGTPSGFTGVLSAAAYAAPTRWTVAGLSAVTDTNRHGTIPPDQLWQHDLAHLLISFGVLATMAVLCTAAAVAILPRTLSRTR
jgi:ABC-type lipoprotein export system ATPase subunit